MIDDFPFMLRVSKHSELFSAPPLVSNSVSRAEVKKIVSAFKSQVITLEDRPSRSRGPMEFQRESKAPTARSTR